LTVFSSSNLVGLFHPTDAHGILSSRAFSSSRAVSPRRRPIPSCRYFLPSTSPRLPGDRGAHHVRLPRYERTRPRVGFRALLSCRARSDRADVTPRGQPMLSWTFSSPGSPFPRRWPDSRLTSSRAWAANLPERSLAGLHSRVLLRAVVASSLSRVPSPNEVSRLLCSHQFGIVRSWVTPRG